MNFKISFFYLFLLSNICGVSQIGTVQSFQKISDTQGGFSGNLSNGDWFGYDISPIGDLDDDGIIDMAVGAIYDDDGGINTGAIYILFMNSNGTVSSQQKISLLYGNFTGSLVAEAFFGSSITCIGDLNNDGVPDLAVGSSGDDDGGNWAGALWILFMNTNGTVQSSQKISALQGFFTAGLNSMDRFGIAVDSIGDFNGDGNEDIVVGAFGDDGNTGAIYLIYLNANGTVNAYNKIDSFQGNFTGSLSSGAFFGWSVSEIGDWDGNGVIDLAVGAPQDDFQIGSVWILLLNNSGSVINTYEISSNIGLNGVLLAPDGFGSSVTKYSSLGCGGLKSLIVGLRKEGTNDKGGVYILDLDSSLNVVNYYPITSTTGDFTSPLGNSDMFGWSVKAVADYTGDGFPEFAVGGVSNDDGGIDKGSIWIISVNSGSPGDLLGNDSIFCSSPLNYLLDPEYYPNATYLWQDGSNDTLFLATSSGLYWVTVTSQNCSITDTINIEFASAPNPIINDTIICLDSNIQINATSGGNSDYTWLPNGDTSAWITAGPGTYSVTINNNCGTTTVSDIEIIGKDCNCNFSIPNVFSPNQDGKNEYFSLSDWNEFCELESFEIFNRWGQKLFFSNDKSIAWDGRLSTGEKAPEGTYYYLIKVNSIYYNGNFSLFR